MQLLVCWQKKNRSAIVDFLNGAAKVQFYELRCRLM